MLDVVAFGSIARGPAPAILAPGREPLSWAGLRVRVDAVGAALAAKGLGRGSRIAVSLANGPEAAVALLSTMTWAACAPVNPALDLKACTEVLARLRLDAVIAADGDDAPVSAAAGALGLPVIRLCMGLQRVAGAFVLRGPSVRAPVTPTAPRSGDVALLMLTSGTTATPKIVPLTHAQILWSARLQPIDGTDRCLCLSPLHTKSGLGRGLVVPLTAGGSTVIAAGYDAAQFVDWLEAYRPTFLSASPTVHAAIVDVLANRAPASPHSLRFVRSSSTALPTALRARLESLWGVPVIEGYGMTEAGLIAQDALPPGERRVGSVGRPFGTQVQVMGDDGPLPPGNVGEILVRGPAVMDGYENDAQANRAAFHDGWLRTGDLGYLDDDGYLYLTGRVKELINRGGLKVSPAEIDATFLLHPAVRDAATCGVPHPSLGEDVVTAVVLREAGGATAQELRDFALRLLPPFKAPSAVVLVDDLPRNALGKVQRQALTESVAATLRTGFIAPRSDDESLVAQVFAALLGLPRVGAHDHFFQLGGDSLRAVQVLSRIAALTGVELERLAVFQAPTVEQLAQRLVSARGAGNAARPVLRRLARDTGVATAPVPDAVVRGGDA